MYQTANYSNHKETIDNKIEDINPLTHTTDNKKILSSKFEHSSAFYKPYKTYTYFLFIAVLLVFVLGFIFTTLNMIMTKSNRTDPGNKQVSCSEEQGRKNNTVPNPMEEKHQEKVQSENEESKPIKIIVLIKILTINCFSKCIN